MIRADLNCDLGEHDDPAGQHIENQLVALVSSVNVACGGHAGNFARLQEIAGLCRQCGTAFGAHPSFPDREGFGRRELQLPPESLLQSLIDQLQLAAAAAADARISLTHVKPHGALYNLAAIQPAIADLVITAIRQTVPSAALIALAGSPLVRHARQAGLIVREEFFADRGYTADGRLLSRQLPGSLITSPQVIGDRIQQLLEQHTVTTVDGTAIAITAETLCIHSDTPGVLEIVRHIRRILDSFHPKSR
jgi:UPF0271 protein